MAHSIFYFLPDSGQRINFTLYDFGVWRRQGSAQTNTFCQSYAVIREGSRSQQTICGGNERTRNVYVSRSNVVHIELAARRTRDAGAFLLEYEGMIIYY